MGSYPSPSSRTNMSPQSGRMSPGGGGMGVSGSGGGGGVGGGSGGEGGGESAVTRRRRAGRTCRPRAAGRARWWRRRRRRCRCRSRRSPRRRSSRPSRRPPGSGYGPRSCSPSSPPATSANRHSTRVPTRVCSLQ